MTGERVVLAALPSRDLRGSSGVSRELSPSSLGLGGSKWSPSVASAASLSSSPEETADGGSVDLGLSILQYF